MVTVALLVLGAFAPKTLAVLANAFASEFDIFVHVDRKVDLPSYKAAIGDARITFIEDRVAVYWAGFSMISASINLIEAAIAGGYNYFCLISDDTIPLTSPESLKSRIESIPGTWLDVRKASPQQFYWKRYSRFFFLDSKFSNPRYYPLEDRIFTDVESSALQELSICQAQGKQPLTDLFCGRQWWVISRSILRNIVNYHYDNERFRLSFKYSAVPDEMYFQTIFRLLHPDEETNGPPVYDDFSRPAKPHSFKDKEELKSLATSQRKQNRFLFVRKVVLTEHLSEHDLHELFWREDSED